MVSPLVPPMPYFGAKTKVAADIWARLGNPLNYVEPFAGSLAVLLARPDEHQWWRKFETVNDADGLVANFHRAIAAAPDEVARHASYPVTEADLTARHLWLVQNRTSIATDLLNDADHYDARAAGWWVWGISCWVGGDWCTGIGPHTGNNERPISRGGTAPGVYRKLPMVSGGHGGKGTHKPPREYGPDVVASTTGLGLVPDVTATTEAVLTDTFAALSNRLRRVRVACGNWDRILNQGAKTAKGHYTAVLLDPPYDPTIRRGDLYGVGDRPDSEPVHVTARTWALTHGADPAYRIAYCTYHADPEDALFLDAGWAPHDWNALGGYGLRAQNRARTNREREVIWFSPACPTPDSAPSVPAATGAAWDLFDTPEKNGAAA